MNESFVLAFIVMPILVVIMGYVAVRLQERQIDRLRKREPTE